MSIVEKITTLEIEIAAVVPSVTGLVSQLNELNLRITAFAGAGSIVATLAETVQEESDRLAQKLQNVQTLVAEIKQESEEFSTNLNEDQERCETIKSVFGDVFHTVNRFFETAKQLGIAEQVKSVFLDKTIPAESKPVGIPFKQTPAKQEQIVEPEIIKPPVLPAAIEDSLPESKPVAVSENTDLPTELTQTELPQDLRQPETIIEESIIEEPVVTDPIVTETAAESVSEKSDAESEPVSEAEPETESLPDMLTEIEQEFAAPSIDVSPLNIPNLPDVSAVPNGNEVLEAETEGDEISETSEEIASQLDVSPLNLGTTEQQTNDDTASKEAGDEQEIENMLADMLNPVTA